MLVSIQLYSCHRNTIAHLDLQLLKSGGGGQSIDSTEISTNLVFKQDQEHGVGDISVVKIKFKPLNFELDNQL